MLGAAEVLRGRLSLSSARRRVYCSPAVASSTEQENSGLTLGHFFECFCFLAVTHSRQFR